MNVKKIFLINSLFFIVLFFIISIHYYKHYNNLKREVIALVENEAESIAKRFEISATKLYYSNKFFKEIIEDNLKSQGKFIDLLNSIEPFKKEELAEFARETNLNIIYLIPFEKNKKLVGFSNVKINISLFYKIKKGIFFDNKRFLIFYKYKGRYSNYYIITGIFSKNYFLNFQKLTIKNLIKTILEQRKEIIDIKFINGNLKKMNLQLINDKYFLVELPFKKIEGKILKIKIDASHGVRIINNFKHNLIVFYMVLIVIGIVVNILIILLQKRYIISLREFERKLYEHEKHVALGRSAALIAHEIRNPVNAVSMGLQRIKYETNIGDNHEYSTLLDIMEKELSNINRTIGIFLDFTKPLKLNKEKVSLNEILKEILMVFKRKKVKIECNIPEDFQVEADKKLIYQAFHNLIKNAFENRESSYLKIYSQGKKIIFENNGVLAEIDCNKIFEPYYTTKTKGTGLGLAVVRKIVKAHNWEIECRQNQGTIRFILTIP